MKKYVTTAIPYANAKPHIGNALDYILADIWARYQRSIGNQVRFQTGTDEHGNKIAEKAAKNNLSPQDYVDQTHLNFKKMMEQLNISSTDFVRTTDDYHIKASQHIWRQLKPYIYKKTYKGKYCQGCEAFVNESEAKANNNICPDHQAEYQAVEEENYFLKTSEFSDRIRQAIESDQMQILPKSRKKEFLNLIKDGFIDVSISRPTSSLTWGVPVPDDDQQTMYVWVDALTNYLSIIGYPDDSQWQQYWPAAVQIIGKDILRFHAGIWPAMLLGAGLELPQTLLVHGHITADGAKMSKTVGNVIDPIEVIEKYGVDAFRYYMVRHIPTQDDGDFSWVKFEQSYNNELANDFGNLISRVANMINKYNDGKFVIKQAEPNSQFNQQMDEFRFDLALENVWQQIRALNKFIDDTKPWELAKSQSEADRTKLVEALDYLANQIVYNNSLIGIFMPETSQKVEQIFKEGQIQVANKPLFPKIYNYTDNSWAKKGQK